MEKKSENEHHCRSAVTFGLDDDDDDDIEDVKKRESHLEVKFFSFKTFWYIVSSYAFAVF